MFHFTSSVLCRVLYLMNSTAGEMNSEACGRHGPLSTVEGLTSKPLFIPQLTGQAAKVSVGEKLFTGLFSMSSLS